MKAIILAGGKATRLRPITLGTSKQLLPIYDKPVIYYPLSILMLLDIRDILIITTSEDAPNFQRLLGNGSDWGIKITYTIQDAPNGLAESFIIGKDFIGSDSVCLILGDNVFFGHGLLDDLDKGKNLKSGAHIFAYEVKNPSAYGVVEFDKFGKVISIEEKPRHPRSKDAIPGIYFFDNDVIRYAETLQPSPRGELEITDLHKRYLDKDILTVSKIGRGIAWLDVGTHESLLQAGNFVSMIEERQGTLIACPEEIAYNQGFINRNQLEALIFKMADNSYKESLIKSSEEDNGHS